MKKLYIFRIASFALAFLFLLCLLIIGKNSGGMGFLRSGYIAEADMRANSYQYTWQTEGISGLAVRWVKGKVNITLVDGPTQEIKITEYANEPLAQEDRLALSSSGGVLQIKWKDEFVSLKWLNRLKKNLHIEVPKALAADMQTLSCDTAVGDITVKALQAETMRLASAAGNITVTDCTGGNLSVNSVSGILRLKQISCESLLFSSDTGDILAEEVKAEKINYATTSGIVELKGISAENLTGRAVSGKADISCEKPPQEMALESVSGNISVCLPKVAGFRIHCASISGKFFSDFPIEPGKSDTRERICGNGESAFTFSTTTANVVLSRAT